MAAASDARVPEDAAFDLGGDSGVLSQGSTTPGCLSTRNWPRWALQPQDAAFDAGDSGRGVKRKAAGSSSSSSALPAGSPPSSVALPAGSSSSKDALPSGMSFKELEERLESLRAGDDEASVAARRQSFSVWQEKLKQDYAAWLATKALEAAQRIDETRTQPIQTVHKDEADAQPWDLDDTQPWDLDVGL